MCAISNPCVIWLMYIYSPAFTPITLPWGFTLHAHLWYCHGVSRYIHTCDIAMGFHAEHTEQNIKIAFSYMSISSRSCKYRLYVYIHYVYVYVHMLIYGDQRHHTKCPKTNQMMNLYPKYVIHIYTYKTIIKMIYIHLYICYTCMLIYSHVHININICICIYTYMCIYVYIYTCIYRYVYIFVYRFVYNYIYTYLHIYIHTLVCTLAFEHITGQLAYTTFGQSMAHF